MTHIPYGYSIVDGKAVIDEEQAAKVRMIFSDYLSGMSLAAVAAKNGLKMPTAGLDNYFATVTTMGMPFTLPSSIRKLSMR